MFPEDVMLVREVLDPSDDEPEDEFDLEGALSSESPAQIRSELEAERARLEEVIAASRSRQRALERYIEALDAKEGEPDPTQATPD